MRHLAHKRARYISSVDNYLKLYTFNNAKEQIVASSGVLNFIWNNWNNFWRDFWLAHVKEGVHLNNTTLPEIKPGYFDKQACHYLMFLCGKKPSHSHGQQIAGSYQEPTWGDPQVIANTATGLLPFHAHMNYLLALLGSYQNSISHFQSIRNTFIHLNNEKVNSLNSLAGFYSFSSDQRLIDILEATSFANGKRCINALTDDMTGMIENLT